MKKILLVLIFTAVAASAYSQTKRIAYLSHSGKNMCYALRETDNLGMPNFDIDFDSLSKTRDSIRRADSANRARTQDSLQKNKGLKINQPKRKVETKESGYLPGSNNVLPDTDNNLRIKSTTTIPHKRQGGYTSWMWWFIAAPVTAGFFWLAKK